MKEKEEEAGVGRESLQTMMEAREVRIVVLEELKVKCSHSWGLGM
jgi:hypothetical protein